MTDISHLDLSKSYTCADYLTWQFRERLEFIKGKIVNQPCKIYAAPFDVRPTKKNKTIGDTITTPLLPGFELDLEKAFDYYTG